MCALFTKRREDKLKRKGLQTYRWGRRRVPPGLRTLLGLVLIVGGVFGFLPVLGFWMIPLGLLFVAMDIPPVRRRIRRWLERSEKD